MLTHFFGFYSLAACVEAAVSQSKKVVSSAAAAVVGIGLFTAPIDSAQAQSGIPVVTEFCIYSNAASDYGLSRGYLACLPTLDTSSSSLELKLQIMFKILAVCMAIICLFRAISSTIIGPSWMAGGF